MAVDTTRPDRDDPLTVALHDLRSDVDRLPLAGSAQIRARGDQRTRRRRAALVGGSALAVAAVMVGSGFADGVLGSRGAPVTPAGPTTSVSSPTPSATPTSGDPSSAPSTTPVSTPPTAPSSAPSSAPTTTPSTVPPGTASGEPAVGPPLSPEIGSVDDRLFLPVAQWRGPDLDSGHAVRWQKRKEDEGMVSVFTCDVDTRSTGDVGLVEVADTVTSAPLGTQRVRRYASYAAADAAVARLVAGVETCQDRLDAVAGNNLRVTVTPDPQNAGSGDGSLFAWRIDVATKDTGAGGTEWVAVMASSSGAHVSTVVLNEPPATTAGVTTVRRVARAAAQHLATTQAVG